MRRNCRRTATQWLSSSVGAGRGARGWVCAIAAGIIAVFAITSVACRARFVSVRDLSTPASKGKMPCQQTWISLKNTNISLQSVCSAVSANLLFRIKNFNASIRPFDLCTTTSIWPAVCARGIGRHRPVSQRGFGGVAARWWTKLHRHFKLTYS